MKTNFDKVKDFHQKFDLEYNGPPRQLDDDMALFRIGFMIEELAEYAKASGFWHLATQLETTHSYLKEGNQYLVERQPVTDKDFHDQFDALVDLGYVMYGTAYLQGFPYDHGYDWVHQANMKKVRVENVSDSRRNSKYDVVKPPDWTPPDLNSLLR